MNGEQDTPTRVAREPSQAQQFRVVVTRIDDTGKPEDDADFVDVLDVRVEVPTEAVLTSGYGAASRTNDQPTRIALQLQIRAALEAARPGA